MPLRSDPTTAAADWAQGLSQATQRIQRGIDSVTQAPGAKAASKADKYLAGVQSSVGLWQRRVAAVSLADWQQAAKDGVGRVAEGAQRKQGKFAQSIGPVFNHMSSVLGSVDNMPDNTLEQRIAKSAAFQRGMAAYKSRAGQ